MISDTFSCIRRYNLYLWVGSNTLTLLMTGHLSSWNCTKGLDMLTTGHVTYIAPRVICLPLVTWHVYCTKVNMPITGHVTYIAPRLICQSLVMWHVHCTKVDMPFTGHVTYIAPRLIFHPLAKRCAVTQYWWSCFMSNTSKIWYMQTDYVGYVIVYAHMYVMPFVFAYIGIRFK